MRIVFLSALALLAVLGILPAAPLPAAPPELASFSPTGIQRGQTAEIVAVGKFGAWPPRILTESPGLTIEPAADKGKLKITAAADAPAGIHWIRLADDEGASLPRPLFVGTFAEAVEKEPNQSLNEAQPLGDRTAVTGTLQRRGDVDVFAVTLQPGQTLVADLVANQLLGSPMDAVLQLCDDAGTVLLQQHDTRGLDPRLVFTASNGGAYFVRLFAFPSQPNSSINFAGGDDYLYRLTLTTGPFVDHALPLAVKRGTTADLTLGGLNLSSSTIALDAAAQNWRDNWLWQPPDASGLVPLRLVDHPIIAAAASASREAPQAVTPPITISGQLGQPRHTHAFLFPAQKGKRLEIRVESSGLGYDMDPVAAVLDASGKTLDEKDDGRRNERDAVLAFNPPADGNYQLQIRDLHGRGGMRMVYLCTITAAEADFSLTLAAGSFQLSPGKTVEVPITVNRQDGFKEEIEISASGLPAGITAEVVRSPGEGEASKSVKLVLKAAGDAKSGPFRIQGRSAGAKPREKAATFETTHGEAKIPHRDLWLGVK